MDFELFLRLIRSLLTTPAVMIEDPEKDLRSFEETRVYSKLLQPMFSKEALAFLMSASSEGTLYELADRLGVCVSLFIFDGHSFLLGPYVKSEYSKSLCEQILIENHMSSSDLISLKLYYTSLPLIYMNQIHTIVNGCIQAFSPNTAPLNYRRLTGVTQASAPSDKKAFEATDYSEIYKRYDSELQFLTTIKNGDVENMKRTFHTMVENGRRSDIFRGTAYANPAVTFAIIRALSRKAAEESGLSVITINEITQRYVQLIEASHGHDEQLTLVKEMILELTKAVHEYRITRGGYSKPVQKALEYIQYHLSEKISLGTLAEKVNVSPTYLSGVFKDETGNTISTYIAKERCRKAAELLRSSELPIQEISDFVGYPDNNYFVKVFKKIYGSTPSDYRKSNEGTA